MKECLDYNNLNLASHNEKYGILVVGMFVDTIASHVILTFMHAFSIYNQILVVKEDTHKITFR